MSDTKVLMPSGKKLHTGRDLFGTVCTKGTRSAERLSQIVSVIYHVDSFS